MSKTAILGNSGSGKTTLARRLAGLTGARVLELDAIAWEPGLPPVPREAEAARANVRAFCEARERWIVEGCYADLLEASLPGSPLLLFLDLPVADCLAHCRSRPFEPEKFPSKEEQDRHLESLLAWVAAYPEREGPTGRQAHLALFAAYPGPKRRVAAPPGPDFAAGLPAACGPPGG